MDGGDEALRDRIYEAAVIPELWPESCNLVSAEVDAFSMALISISSQGSMRAVSSPEIAGPMADFMATDLASQNPRPQRALEVGQGTFLRDLDLMSQAELDVDPIYQTFLKPLGLGWTVGAIFQEPAGSHLIFDVIGRLERGPFSTKDVDRLNSLKPDLARAAFLTTRLAFKEAQTITGTLSSIGLPAAVLGETGSVVAMNQELEALSHRFRTGHGDRLHFVSAAANQVFQSTLQRMKAGVPPEVQSIAIAAEEDAPPLVVQIVPVRRNARDIFSRGRIILVVTTVGEMGPPNLRILCGLFDLTRAEARVAQELTSGKSLRDVADALKVSYETVRTHAKAVFRKTGVNRQSELATLLSGMRGAEKLPAE